MLSWWLIAVIVVIPLIVVAITVVWIMGMIAEGEEWHE